MYSSRRVPRQHEVLREGATAGALPAPPVQEPLLLLLPKHLKQGREDAGEKSGQVREVVEEDKEPLCLSQHPPLSSTISLGSPSVEERFLCHTQTQLMSTLLKDPTRGFEFESIVKRGKAHLSMKASV